MGPDRDRTCNPWICSQTCICSQACYRLSYAAWLRYSAWLCSVSSGFMLFIKALSVHKCINHTRNCVHSNNPAKWMYKYTFLTFPTSLFMKAAKFTHIHILLEPVHEISNNGVCATSKASDHPVHTRSLIRALASRLSILWLLSYWLNTIWSF